MIYKKGGKSAAMAFLYNVHYILISLHYTYTSTYGNMIKSNISIAPIFGIEFSSVT